MLIAVAALNGRVPERFEQAEELLLFETESAAVAASYPRAGGDAAALARIAAESGTEAVCCGMIADRAVFDVLADAGVTRCHAPGLSVSEAARAAEAGRLPLIVRPGMLH